MRMQNVFGTITLIGMFGLTNTADAKKGKDEGGILIEITVLDAQTQEPIPTAVIKHTLASQPSKVNSVTGTWSDTESIDKNAVVHEFQPGNVEEFSISASGYMTQVVTYDVRRRNNVIEIGLEPMEIIAPKLDDTIIPFGRDTVKTDNGPGGAQ